MAFGAGVLLSAVSFELIAEAHEQGGLLPTALGAAGGAVVYTLANVALARHGARHRKRSGDQQPSENEQPGSGSAIAVGALLDGIPESVVIGASLLSGGTVSLVTVAAVFLSNVPEGLSSAAGMRQAGRTRRYVFLLWTGIALISGVAALLGNTLLGGAPPEVLAGITALAMRRDPRDDHRHHGPRGVRGRAPARRSGHGRRLPDRVRPVPQLTTGHTATSGAAVGGAAVCRRAAAVGGAAVGGDGGRVA